MFAPGRSGPAGRPPSRGQRDVGAGVIDALAVVNEFKN